MNQTKSAQTKEEIRTIIVDQTAEWKETLSTTRSAIASTEADIRRLETKQAQVQGVVERMNRALDNLVVKENVLQELESKLSSLPTTKEEEFIVFHDGDVPAIEYLAHFRDLASISDLGSIGSIKELQGAFASVSNAMDTYLEEAGDSMQWASINQVFRDSSYPDKSSKLSACPAITDVDDEENSPAKEEDSEILESGNSKDAPSVTEEDVLTRQNEIRAAWESLYEDRVLPVSDAEIKRLEKVRQGLVEKWIQRVQDSLDEALDKVDFAIAEAQRDVIDEEGLVTEVVEDDEGTNSNCAKTDDILNVLEAGIEAVHRKENLQEALRQAMTARDRQLGDVILDADLPLGETRPQAMGPSTLRQYLDSELTTHDVPRLIHAIVDLVGGYHDQLDKLIDTLPENVGEIAVKNALDVAGFVNLSKIQRQLNGYIAAAEKRIADLMS